MRIAILGATGVAGRALIPLLQQGGHTLRAAARNQASAQALTGAGVEAVRADILDAASLPPLLAGCDAVINLATAIPKAGSTNDWALNDRVRAEGTANLIAACIAAGVPRLLQQGVAMLHCVDDSRPQTETDPIEGYGVLLSAAQLERSVAESPLDWRIARGGLFYGPGSGREATWQAELANPEFRIPGDGSAWHSLVHVHDFARALALIVTHPREREAYIVCDDMPLQLRDLYQRLAQQHGLSPPPTGGPMRMRSFRASNAKLRGIGWTPQYPALAQGL